jgi:hypothetical protein
MWLLVSKRGLWLHAFQTQTPAFGKRKFHFPDEWAHFDTVLNLAGEIVAQASSPAGSGGVPPHESSPTVDPRSETLREPAAVDGCATRTVSRCAWTNQIGGRLAPAVLPHQHSPLNSPKINSRNSFPFRPFLLAADFRISAFQFLQGGPAQAVALQSFQQKERKGAKMNNHQAFPAWFPSFPSVVSGLHRPRVPTSKCGSKEKRGRNSFPFRPLPSGI